MLEPEIQQLFIRIDDIARRSVMTDSHFLNAKEQYFLKSHLDFTGYAGKYIFYGGCEGTERKMLFFLPDYVVDMADGVEDVYAFASQVLLAELEDTVTALKITGSGYRSLSHRDYMGSILGLGIERFVVGDIILNKDENSAIVFCEKKIAEYILSELNSVGADKVKVERAQLPQNFEIKREFKTVSDTIASSRTDCVVAALAGCSRESAKELMRYGEVEKNYSVCKKPDAEVNEGDVITVRGHGKFVVRSIADRTKKNRIRLVADKYI